MTKISNQYSLTNILTADLANSRLGINNVSPTVALDVTGAGKFSGTITSQVNGSTFGTASATGRAIIIQAGSTNQAIMFKNAANGDATLFINGTSTTVDYNFNTYSVGDALVIKNSGNVGIGTSSPTDSIIGSGTFLDIASTGGGALKLHYTNATAAGELSFYKGSNGSYIDSAGAATLANNDLIFRTGGTVSNYGVTERMRITSAGNVGIGLSSTPDKLGVQGTANNWTGKFLGSTVSGNSFGVDIVAGTTDGDYPLYIRTTNYSLRLFVRGDGVCYIGASSWVYNSDRRVKENILDVTNGLDLVSKLKPKHFDYINGAKDNLGFIAQEVQELIPQAVTISDEKTGMLGLKTDFIIPYLVKSIQELSAKVSLLENK